jgi:alkylhydroperoxidase family enzyme
MCGEARIPLLPLEEAVRLADQLEMREGTALAAPFRVFLNHPRFAKALLDFIGVFLDDPVLDPRLRELIILRIAWKARCVALWSTHWYSATEREGLPPSDLAALRHEPLREPFDGLELGALRAADEMLETGEISDPAWAFVRVRVPNDKAAMELLGVMGTYRMITGILNSARVPFVSDRQAWPPDGMPPS